jgi:hypothetical protein
MQCQICKLRFESAFGIAHCAICSRHFCLDCGGNDNGVCKDCKPMRLTLQELEALSDSSLLAHWIVRNVSRQFPAVSQVRSAIESFERDNVIAKLNEEK